MNIIPDNVAVTCPRGKSIKKKSEKSRKAKTGYLRKCSYIQKQQKEVQVFASEKEKLGMGRWRHF